MFDLHAQGRTKVIATGRKLEDVNASIDDVLAGTVPARIVFEFLRECSVMVYRVASTVSAGSGARTFGVRWSEPRSPRLPAGATIEVVAINDLWPPEMLAHLLAFDSTSLRLRSGRNRPIDGDVLQAGARWIKVLAERDPAQLPWADLDVDLVIEATGRFRTREAAGAHPAGARKVLLSVPGKDVDGTVVLGVSSDDFSDPQYEIVSAASCTTNCAAPMTSVLHRAFGLERGFLTTVHAYTNDQVLLDTPHKDPRRARSAAVNIIIPPAPARPGDRACATSNWPAG